MKKRRIGFGLAAVMMAVLLLSGTAFASDGLDAFLRGLVQFATGSQEQAPDTADGAQADGRVEGPGYASPEEALMAYVQGWVDGDINEMMAAFAVETYVEHCDVAAIIDRLRSYNYSIKDIPNISDLSFQINVEMRKQDITNTIRTHYLVLTGAEVVMGSDPGMTVFLDEEYATGEALAERLFASDDSTVTGGIRYENEILDLEFFEEYYDNYTSEANQENLRKQAAAYGAEEIRSVATVFYCGEVPVLLIMDAARYDGKWYLFRDMGNLGNIMGMNSFRGGMVY